MSNSEDYLDGLLSSINRVKSKVEADSEEAEASRRARMERRNHIRPEDDFMEASGLKGYTPTEIPRTNLRRALTEEDFLREFEEELENGQADSFIAAFEQEIDEEERLFEQSLYGESDRDSAASDATGNQTDSKSGDDIYSTTEDKTSLMDDIEDIVSMASSQSEDEDMVGALPGDEGYQESTAWMPGLDEFAPDALDEEDALLSGNSSDGESELTDMEVPLMDEQRAGEDLMDLLREQEGVDLEEISAMLKADEEHVELKESQDAFEEQVEETQLFLDEDIDSEESPAAGSGGVKGFFEKLKSMFSDDEEKEIVKIKEQRPENLSDENLEILKSLEDADKKEKQDKKKKGKKEKKPKKEKEPKEKKVREKKPKKEKPPKEPDNSPVIAGKVMVVFLLFAVSVIALLYIGSSMLGYQRQLSQADRAYRAGNYVEAFEALVGVEVKEDDMETLYRVRMLADLQKRQQDYDNFMRMEEYEYALDALIMGVGRYHQHLVSAEDYGITSEYQAVGQALEEQLMNQFGVSSEDAVEYYRMKKRELYTQTLQDILESLGLR